MFADKRQEIVDALNAIDGITGSLYQPSAPKAGSAWVQRAAMDREIGSWWVNVWTVMVFVGQTSVQAADNWLEENLDALVDGLIDIGYATNIEQTNLGSEVEPSFGLTITLRSE